MPQDWDAEIEIERRQVETFRRIHRLYKRGFRPDGSVPHVQDAIWWMHPGDYPDLILYPNGMLVCANERAVLDPKENADKDHIYNESMADDATFESWLEATPKPSWLQSGKYARERYIWMPFGLALFYGLLWGISFGFAKIVRTIWHSLTG